MNYIVFDLEFNQKYALENNIPSPISFEIIQIGALKLNDKLNVISTFNTFVKPTVYTEIHPYIVNLTKITTEKVSLSKPFPNIYKDFINFIGDDDTTFCTWGTADIKELNRNIEFHKLDSNVIPKKFIDVQKIASIHTKASKGIRIGLSNAIEVFNIPLNGVFHDAFNDAYYTSEIFKKLYSSDLKPSLYNNKSDNKRTVETKKIIDTDSLIAQFEKMYNREMTYEEKTMIKLAYIMGKTNQFLI